MSYNREQKGVEVGIDAGAPKELINTSLPWQQNRWYWDKFDHHALKRIYPTNSQRTFRSGSQDSLKWTVNQKPQIATKFSESWIEFQTRLLTDVGLVLGANGAPTVAQCSGLTGTVRPAVAAAVVAGVDTVGLPTGDATNGRGIGTQVNGNYTSFVYTANTACLIRDCNVTNAGSTTKLDEIKQCGVYMTPQVLNGQKPEWYTSREADKYMAGVRTMIAPTIAEQPNLISNIYTGAVNTAGVSNACFIDNSPIAGGILKPVPQYDSATKSFTEVRNQLQAIVNGQKFRMLLPLDLLNSNMLVNTSYQPMTIELNLNNYQDAFVDFKSTCTIPADDGKTATATTTPFVIGSTFANFEIYNVSMVLSNYVLEQGLVNEWDRIYRNIGYAYPYTRVIYDEFEVPTNQIHINWSCQNRLIHSLDKLIVVLRRKEDLRSDPKNRKWEFGAGNARTCASDTWNGLTRISCSYGGADIVFDSDLTFHPITDNDALTTITQSSFMEPDECNLNPASYLGLSAAGVLDPRLMTSFFTVLNFQSLQAERSGLNISQYDLLVNFEFGSSAVARPELTGHVFMCCGGEIVVKAGSDPTWKI